MAVVGGTGYGLIAGAFWVRDTIRTQDAAQAVSQATTAYPVPTDCAMQDLDVSVAAPLEVPAGAGMSIEVTVANSGAEPCLFDAGTQNIGAVITSGSDTVWVSTACTNALVSRPLLVGAGQSATAVLSWDGKSTDPTCLGQSSAEPEPAEETPEPDAQEAGDGGTEEASPAATETAPSADPRLASAGTYRLRIQIAGEDVTDEQIFVIQ